MTNQSSKKKRKKHETKIIKIFENTAKLISNQYNEQFRIFKGQNEKNTKEINKKVKFQFGDLRVELSNYTIVIEVESSGGVTNLLKYWYLIEKGKIEKPLFLIHLYRQTTKNDYNSHVELWKFIWEKMNSNINNGTNKKMEAYCYTYKDEQNADQDNEKYQNDLKDSIKGAINKFEVLIKCKK